MSPASATAGAAFCPNPRITADSIKAALGAVEQGKVIELDLEETDEETARETVTRMCERLLANTVIESYTVELV